MTNAENLVALREPARTRALANMPPDQIASMPKPSADPLATYSLSKSFCVVISQLQLIIRNQLALAHDAWL